jgi:hypothetical protein
VIKSQARTLVNTLDRYIALPDAKVVFFPAIVYNMVVTCSRKDDMSISERIGHVK